MNDTRGDFWRRLASFSLAARGLLAITITVTSLLAWMSPSSLTARAVDPSGIFGDALVYAGLVFSALAWADILVHDILGLDLLKSSGGPTAESWAAVLAFVARCNSAGVRAIVLTSPSMGSGGQAAIDVHNAKVRAEAAANGYTVADVAAGWNAATMTYTDGQHWTEAGEFHAADAVLVA